MFLILDAWLKILQPVEGQRKDTNRVNLFPGYITGEVGAFYISFVIALVAVDKLAIDLI